MVALVEALSGPSSTIPCSGLGELLYLIFFTYVLALDTNVLPSTAHLNKPIVYICRIYLTPWKGGSLAVAAMRALAKEFHERCQDFASYS